MSTELPPPIPVDGFLKIDPHMSTERKIDALIEAFKRLTMTLQNLLVMRIYPLLEIGEATLEDRYVTTNALIIVTDNSLAPVYIE